MPVEILHNAVAHHQAGDIVDASVLGSSAELRRLLDLGAVRMVPANSPEKPVELTAEQAQIVQANSELSDRLDALEEAHRAAVKEIERLLTLLNGRSEHVDELERENKDIRFKAESAAHEGGMMIRTLTAENTDLRLQIEQLKKVQTSAPEPKQPKKKS